MKRWLRDLRPHRSPIEWAMTVKGSPGWVMKVGKPVQIIGGKTWTISFMRIGEGRNVPVTEFWKDKT